MKVVHYIKRVRLAEGGVVRAVLDTTFALAAAGVDTTLITSDPSDIPPGWAGGAAGPRVVVVPDVRGPLQRLTPAALDRAETCIADADCVHLHALWHPSNAQIAALAHRLGIPTVLSVHGMLGDWSMSASRLKKLVFLRLFGQDLLERAAAVHLTCQDELDQAGKRFRNPTRSVIPLPIDLTPFSPRINESDPPTPAEPPAVLFLSRLHPVKGVELLLRAAGLLRDRGTPARFLIAGPGEEGYIASLKALSESLELGGSVNFMGPVYGPDKSGLYRSADIFALPSEHENFGIVWAEAMASGLPTVVTRGVGPWKELETGGGAVVAERTPEGLAAALQPLVEDRSSRHAMGRTARIWVTGYLDPRHVTARYMDLYRGVRLSRA